MDSVDYAHLAERLDGDHPAGADPEYDPVFLELADILRPSGPGMVSADAAAPDAPPVDWAGARAKATELAATTRDIRLTMRLARLSLMDGSDDGGVPGFAAALDVAAALTETMWDDVHPLLDADDDMDATMRLNAYGDLEDPVLVNALLDVPVARAGRMQATLRELETAIGKREPGPDVDLSVLTGRLDDIFSREDLVTARDAALAALDALARIRTAWTSAMTELGEARGAEGLRFDNLPAPQMQALDSRLSDMARLIGDRLPEPPETEDEADGGEGGTVRATASGPIASREDADRQILKIIEWFTRNEPSSPVPALLERARSMISKSFLEIIDELGEGGITEARRASGDASGGSGDD